MAEIGTVIGDLLPLAVGVSISPIPLVAAILMILSKNASAAAGGFATGLTAGIVLATVVFAVLAGAIGLSGDSGPSGAVAWMKIGLGLLLLAVAVAQWGHRADTAEPGVDAGIDRITASRAVLLGATLAGGEPEESAVVRIGWSGGRRERTGGRAQTVAVVLFHGARRGQCAGVVSVTPPADRLRGTLDRARAWLQVNNHGGDGHRAVGDGCCGQLGKGIGGL